MLSQQFVIEARPKECLQDHHDRLLHTLSVELVERDEDQRA